MMKLKTLFAIAIGYITIGCASSQSISLENGKSIDKKLIGVWNGSYQNQESNLSKIWEIERKKDGTYTIVTSRTVNGRMQKIKNSGNWWTENMKYYQKSIHNETPEIYEYSVLNNKQIQFSSIDPDNGNYIFTDHKKE